MHTTTATTTATQPAWARDVAIAAVGPAALGLCSGWAFGGTAPITMAALVPLAFLIVAIVTLPGLYVGSTLLGASIDLKASARLSVQAGRDLGVIFLGLAPALLFLSATATDQHEAIVLGLGAALMGAAVGIRAFYSRLREVEGGYGLLAAFAVWALLGLVLGTEIYMEMLRIGGGLP